MSKHTLTIELAKPLEWVRVEDSPALDCLKDMRYYAIRKDGYVFTGYLNRTDSIGLGNFEKKGSSYERGPSGHFPFEVALIETPPWPIVHKDADGWIDLEKTPVELLELAVHYELLGDWEGSAWGWAFSKNGTFVHWGNAYHRGQLPLPPPYNKPTRCRTAHSSSIPEEWRGGPPKQPEPETMEQRVARLEAQMKEVSKAAGKGGGE